MKDIPGYEDIYGITDDGKVWSKKRNIWVKPWLSKKRGKPGYLGVKLNKNKKRQSFLVHRLVAMAYLSPIEGHPHINHINAIKTDNRVENLEWCTPAMNTAHAKMMGLLIREKGQHPNAKVSESQVEEIRSLKGELSAREVSKRYGLTLNPIYDIWAGKTWT